MALYRCNRCGHLSESPDDLVGTTAACPACGSDNPVYPTVAFLRTMLDRYFATRRELAEARAELDRLRSQGNAPPAPVEIPPGPPTLPSDFDAGNTDHFCSRVQVAPVLDWFRHAGVTADLDPRSLETTGAFDEVSAAIGNQHAELRDIVERIRAAQQQDYSFINIDLGKRTPAEITTLNTFCQTLSRGGFLSKVLYQDGDQVVRLSLQKAEGVRRFFDGGWLGWYAYMRGLRHLVAAGVEFSVARDVSLSWPRDEGHTLDLVFLVGTSTPLCIQCRTGDPTPHLDRLLHLRDRLGVDPQHYLLCISDLGAQAADQLARRHGLEIATPQTLPDWLARRVPRRSSTA
jgi:hypothetical protein